jgi:hypothetical protein
VPFTVSGRIQVNKIAKDPVWTPIARVRIGSAQPGLGKAPDQYAGFVLTALPGKAVKLRFDTVQAFNFDAKGRDSEIIPGSIGPTGTAQPFQITYDGKSVGVNIAGQTRSYAMVSNAPVIDVICSTGDFLFTDVLIAPQT